ncbi:hypothetical protein ZTR_06061 [Talaromyces verruculosus]|nr:hypothetical protein ZTR_06061 [Talaromyces verruculosus]
MKLSASKAAPYSLRLLLDKVPLTAEGGEADVYITCVEYWNGNLYIGTSAAEILHFVSLPSQRSDDSNESNFILATRLPISGYSEQLHGIEQIVLLPVVNKACILCNGAVTFYTLPELSPAFENTTLRCRWIGGLNLNQSVCEDANETPSIMIAMQNRIMLVRISDTLQNIRNIEFPGSLAGLRRDTIACVANEKMYSLLEVEHQQKLPLFPIVLSSDVFDPDRIENVSQSPTALECSSSASYSDSDIGKIDRRERSTSLDAFDEEFGVSRASPKRLDRSGNLTADPFGTASPRRSISGDRRDLDTTIDLPTTGRYSEAYGQKAQFPASKLKMTRLKPHIVSTTPSEFLLITGTAESELGVGIFVDTNGDVVRGTMEFQRYPEAVVVDSSTAAGQEGASTDTPEGFVLAILNVDEDDNVRTFLEIQRLDVNPGEKERRKTLLEIPTLGDSQAIHVGMGHTTSPSDLNFFDLEDLLPMVKLQTPKTGGSYTSAEQAGPRRTNTTIEHLRTKKEHFEPQELFDYENAKMGSLSQAWELERVRKGAAFTRGSGKTQANLVLWSGDQIWRIVKNPLPLQLDALLESTQTWEDCRLKYLDKYSVMDLLNSMKTVDPRTEVELLGLRYIKQKASLLLLADMLSMNPASRTDIEMHATEEVLLESDLDPRLVLSLVPFLADEVALCKQGIWAYHSLAQLAEYYLDGQSEWAGVSLSPGDPVLDLIKRYLFAWQKRRGSGSVTNDTNIFDSVDAALLHLVLEQEAEARRTSRPITTIRHELNGLVDYWKGNFDRATSLLERYQRLFVLSRLYRSRKMLGQVLKVWRRIADGEKDDDPEVTISGVEEYVRKHLGKITDKQLIKEYGLWLASRNPRLGIQVFSDDTSHIKLDQNEIVQSLKIRAPNAVQQYLEYLVFSKNNFQYVDDLIAYYLDSVIDILRSSPEACTSLQESYSTYRALRPPKQTYLNFITENASPDAWWQRHLRLLQLLDGPSTLFTSTTGMDLKYPVLAVLSQVEHFKDELVPESIILYGRQGRHREALQLLTHCLGDYDSAVRYCLFGGITSAQTATAALSKSSEQAELFRHLLTEFLRIEDVSDRIERTSNLLTLFSDRFDVYETLAQIPDDWSVDNFSGFLTHVFRDLVSQGREVRVQKALSASFNLRE